MVLFVPYSFGRLAAAHLEIGFFVQLGRALFNHLKVYKGPDHPHEAQKPIDLPIRDKRIQIQR